MVSVYKRRIENNVTFRDYDSLKKFIKLIQWGRSNPVQFIEQVLGITLMDYQKWLISESWTREYVVWACSRNAGKSFLTGCFLMARNLLFPKLQTQIIAENWATSNDTFRTMENIATNNIKSLIMDNTVFIDELYRTKSDSDGFIHDNKLGNKCELCNGSKISAIAGSSRSARGRRSNINVYDEAGFVTKETFDITEPYMGQTSEFRLGASFDPDVYPKEIPNIRLYIGSASDTNSYFYQRYKEGFKKMLAGDNKYFVADVNCEIPKHPTVNGTPAKPLLSQSEIDRKMRENEIVAMREYYNIFDNFNLEDSIVTRSDILTNTENFVPCLSWGGKKHKYIISYDPASRNDNAPVLVTEIFKNGNEEICGRFVHMENLVIRFADGSKKPMRLDEQVQRLREIIYEYNGRENVPYYQNVTVLLDNGTGGQAPAIAQELCKDWTDRSGRRHPGLYDEESEDMKRWKESFPHAVGGSLHLIEPRKYRNELFEATKTLVPMGVIKFPPVCPKHGIIVLDDGTEKKLNKNEEQSLIQMDLMKEEILAMVRSKNPNGNITYQLPPEKRGKMHDDRSYTLVLACWWLYQLRTNETLGETVALDYTSFFDPKQKSVHKEENDPWLSRIKGRQNKISSPFQGKSPFRQ